MVTTVSDVCNVSKVQLYVLIKIKKKGAPAMTGVLFTPCMVRKLPFVSR